MRDSCSYNKRPHRAPRFHSKTAGAIADPSPASARPDGSSLCTREPLSPFVHVNHANILLPELQKETEASPPRARLPGLVRDTPTTLPNMSGGSESERVGGSRPAPGPAFILAFWCETPTPADARPSPLTLFIFFLVFSHDSGCRQVELRSTGLVFKRK